MASQHEQMVQIMSKQVEVTINDHVMEITFNRPPVNAIDLALSRAMFGAFKEELNDNPDLRVAILSGAGNAKGIFSAGWDLKAFAAGESRTRNWGSILARAGWAACPSSSAFTSR